MTLIRIVPDNSFALVEVLGQALMTTIDTVLGIAGRGPARILNLHTAPYIANTVRKMEVAPEVPSDPIKYNIRGAQYQESSTHCAGQFPKMSYLGKEDG